ncbi:MAG: CoA transferase [Chloroflexi bacterium]|nr:CoA transferase [Chloroflexota bacterium]
MTDTTTERRGPLRGIRVLEFSQIVAGPLAGVLLSDLGAEVVKVEPIEGEARRNTGAVVPNEGKYFQSLNRGKRSLVVDLQRPEGRALIQRIVPAFDVVLTNYRAGVTARLGIDYATLSALRPDLIYANVTGFGEDGPYAARAGTDVVAQAYSGLLAAEGKTDELGAPLQLSATPVIDRSTGIAAAMGIAAALFERERTGVGQELHLSLLHTGLELLSQRVMREPVHDATTRDPLVAELQRRRAEGAPYDELIALRQAEVPRFASHRLYYGGYHTAAGALVLGAVTRSNRDALRTILDMADATDHADFDAAAPGAAERVEAWRLEIQSKLLARSAEQWVELMLTAGVPASVVHFPEEMSDDPQVEAMGMMATLTHEITGPQRVVGPLVRFDRTPAEAAGPAPVLGAHSRAILAEAGVPPDEIDRLRDAGIIAG